VLFTRAQHDSAACNDGYGKPGYAKDANCDYKKAPFFNVLAAFWIQFNTHDWFSHLDEGHNAPQYMAVGCATKRVNGADVALPAADIARLGCRPGDQIDQSFVADSSAPGTFTDGGLMYLTRAPKTFRNTNTAWWDASQLYGYDDRSRLRVKRDRSTESGLGGTGIRRIPGQLDRRSQLLPQRVRARAQSVRRHVPAVRSSTPGRRLRPS
jgi:hypothetical protein